MFIRKVFKTLAVTTLALTLALPFTAYASQWIQSTAAGKSHQMTEPISRTNGISHQKVACIIIWEQLVT